MTLSRRRTCLGLVIVLKAFLIGVNGKLDSSDLEISLLKCKDYSCKFEFEHGIVALLVEQF